MMMRYDLRSNLGLDLLLQLLAPDGEDDESAEELPSKSSKAKKPKKKKKKETAATIPAAPAPPPTSDSPALDPASKKERKALKKAKAKEKKEGANELDKALAELSVKYPELQNVQKASTWASHPSSSHPSSTLASLLAVSLSHLDSEAELRKFFGAKVISANKPTAPSPPGAPSSTRRAPISQRSQLTRPGPTWWPAKFREGLSVKAYDEGDVRKKLERYGWAEVPGEVWWSVEYSKRYKGITMAFMQAVMSGDPENFRILLGKLPWHADTLLQLAEAYRYREEHSEAMDFIDRALFTYERAFVGSFNFTSGANRLDFDRVENRPFFLAIHRQVADLQRRGCFRTSFEFARLLLNLDPSSDPHGAFLHLDFLAIKAGMSQWLLDVWEFYDAQANDPNSAYRERLNVTALPGWAYSRALALRMKEDSQGDKSHESSTAALRDAILAFPSVLPLLADKADIPLSADVRGHKAFRIHTDSSSLAKQSDSILHLLSHLYAQRSSSLWKKPSYTSWVSTTATSVLSSVPQSPITNPHIGRFVSLFGKLTLAYSVYRHAVVLESSFRSLFSFIPREVFSARQLACDPVPPPTKVNEYDEEFFRGVSDVFDVTSRSRRHNERTLERLIPDPVFRRQLQDFFEANPRIAERFPGGLIQFAQMAGQLPEEVLEDLLIAGAMEAEEGGGRAMPGEMPMDEFEVNFGPGVEEGGQDHGDPIIGDAEPGVEDAEDEDDFSEEEDGEEGQLAPMPVRIIRNIMNRFWGGTVAAEESSDSDVEGGRPGDNDVD
ncbi:hypothetical protein JAAARDRAFT_28803 [Jaapia argillacea MUCL 33604]|uniref:DUF654-domain-containing protein n=1 Tax=Jaapia argillacea MUCL 33604 TaxID=933084 RepID=A0A067QG29_9AGAM|nr:hypothetical protein JAAARDRAFT_28803 [Jaapia argillacea MUCL 33604]